MTFQRAELDRRRFLAGVAGVAGLAAMAQAPMGPAEATPAIQVATTRSSSASPVATRRRTAWFSGPGWSPSCSLLAAGCPGARSRCSGRSRAIPASATSCAVDRPGPCPELAHSVHVVVKGLKPGREWFYRFKYRGDVSPVGRTKTAPAYTGPDAKLTLAVASCQAWDYGYYSRLSPHGRRGPRLRAASGRLRLRVRHRPERRPAKHRRSMTSSWSHRPIFRDGDCSTSSTRATPTCSASTVASPGS